MVNEFLKYGICEVRDKLLKIMSMIFEKGEVPSNLRKSLIKPLHKKGDKSKCCNYRGISLVSVESKLLSMTILFRPRDIVHKGLREELCSFRKVSGCINQIFPTRLINNWKCLSHQTPLVLSFVDYQ